MLATGLNVNLSGHDQMALKVERQIVHWMRELFQFPNTASDLFVIGSSSANLMGMPVARTRALGKASRISGVNPPGIAPRGVSLIATAPKPWKSMPWTRWKPGH